MMACAAGRPLPWGAVPGALCGSRLFSGSDSESCEGTERALLLLGPPAIASRWDTEEAETKRDGA